MSVSNCLTFHDDQWLQQLTSSIYEMQTRQLLCDVSITDRDGVITLAHSSILAASSTVFSAMFKESYTSRRRPHYSCQLGVATSTIKDILEFIYTGKLTIPDSSALAQVFVLASELHISSLLDWCTSLGVDCDSLTAGDDIPLKIDPDPDPETVESSKDSVDEAVAVAVTRVKIECDTDEQLTSHPVGDIPSPASSDTEIDDAVGASPDKCTAVKIEASDASGTEEPVVESNASIGSQLKAGRTYACHRCKKTFRQKGRLKTHKLHCSPEEYYCDICEMKVSARNVKMHKARHEQDNKKLTCENCGAVFKWAGSLQKHWKSHPDWKPYPCKMCPERFASGKELKSHKQAQHKGKHKCQQCGKVLTTSGKFTEHMKRHANAREYICCVCAKRFNTKSQLTQHEILHLGLKPFKCDLCPKACGSQRHLDEHKISHSSEKPYSCQYCGNRQKYMSGLRAHEKLHIMGKTVKCETCGKKFATTSQLKQHMTSHTGEKPHTCTLCGQRFTCASAKRRHEFAHTGLKPFPCGTCGKMFADKRDVREHEKIHASEKTEQCQQCGKCFHTAGGLKAHKRTHEAADRQLYYCTVCSKSFMRSHNRNIHEVNVHGLPPRKRYHVPVLNAPVSSLPATMYTAEQPIDTVADVSAFIPATVGLLNMQGPFIEESSVAPQHDQQY